MIICGALYLIILMSALIRGGKGLHSIVGLDTCSWMSWLIFIVVQLVCFFSAVRVYKIQKEEEECSSISSLRSD